MNKNNSKQPTVFIVDDNEEFLSELAEIVSEMGYRTQTCSRGDEAVSHIKKMLPDVILLDLKMPGKSGFQVADELRFDRRTSKVPIIAMTGYYTANEHKVLMDICGIKTRLIKPFDLEKLGEEIKRNLKGKGVQ